MTMSEQDKINYKVFTNLADKMQESIDTGVLNKETISILEQEIIEFRTRAKRYKNQLESYGFTVED